MKKVVYSTMAKWIMVLLIASAVFIGCYTLEDYYAQVQQEENQLFSVESLLTVEGSIAKSGEPYTAIISEVYQIGQYTRALSEESLSTEGYEQDAFSNLDDQDRKSLLEESKEALLKKLDSSNYDYYILLKSNDGEELVNEKTIEYAEIPDHIQNNKYGYYYSYYSGGDNVIDSTANFYSQSIVNLASESILYIQPKQNLQLLWKSQQEKFVMAMSIFAIATVITLFALIWLIVTVGRNGEGALTKCFWFDKIWMEIWIGLLVLPIAIGYGGAVAFLWSYQWIFMRIFSSLTIAFALIVLAGILLIEVKNLKNHTFWKRSIIVRVFAGIFRRLGFFISQLFSGKLAITIVIGFVCYTIFVALCHLGGGMVIVTIALACIIAYSMVYIIHELLRIKKGVKEISEGKMDFELKESKIKVLNNHIYHINHLKDGLKLAVDREVAAQKMQTELITNVSHDLKTPLTSIISYSELLCGLELEPEEARDYAKIVQQKSLRLKTLTTNLFEFSKATSGVEKFVMEEIDLALLINQVLGELEHEMREKNYQYKITVPEVKAAVWADGGKLQRVIENLMGNALKYSLEGTRIFVDLTGDEEYWYVVMKNTSAYPIDFDVEEITKRFVRGDESRTTEGNGLGLAIAKSYIEGCKGRLLLEADGDLFKAIASFPKYEK